MRNSGLTEHDVYSLAAVRRNEGTRLYLGTEPAHIFCSDDLGRRWRELTNMRSVPSVPKWKFPVPPHIAHTKHITFAPGDPKIVYACIEVGALLRSRDAGETWEQIEGVYEDVHRLAIHPKNPNRLYVVTGHGLYVSSDGGASFEQWVARPSPIAGYPDGIVIHPRKPDLMFLGAADTGPGTWMKTAGTFVFPSFTGANYDPGAFADPHEFDIRKPAPAAPQLTFGSGIHYCLGASLARAELQEALPILARRMPDLALDGDITWKPETFGIWGPLRLPLRFTPS